MVLVKKKEMSYSSQFVAKDNFQFSFVSEPKVSCKKSCLLRHKTPNPQHPSSGCILKNATWFVCVFMKNNRCRPYVENKSI
jgi:hypothetical protein